MKHHFLKIIAVDFEPTSSGLDGDGVATVGSLLVAAAIEALRTVVNGGFMPHARHGGR